MRSTFILSLQFYNDNGAIKYTHKYTTVCHHPQLAAFVVRFDCGVHELELAERTDPLWWAQFINDEQS